jgi:thymidylate synthase (FAD)
MGNDETIVQCARQSYKKDNDELSEDTIERQINQMLKNGHSSPFEQVVFRFHLRTPIFVARQIVRHRTARMNELSGRYSEFSEDSFHIPDKTAFENRREDDFSLLKNKDYIAQIQEPASQLSHAVKYINNLTFNTYKDLIDNYKVPRELARMILGLNLYTEFYWQMDLHNLLHFLELRLEEHAQKEIKEYALVIYHLVKKICPITIKYFTEYQLNKMVLGEQELGDLYSIFYDITSGEGIFEKNDINTNVYQLFKTHTELIDHIEQKHKIIQRRNNILETKGKYVDEQLNILSNK